MDEKRKRKRKQQPEPLVAKVTALSELAIYLQINQPSFPSMFGRDKSQVLNLYFEPSQYRKYVTVSLNLHNGPLKYEWLYVFYW